MASGGHDPAKLLKWIIQETAQPHYNNNDNNNDDKEDNNDNIPITRLSDMNEEEKKKWTDIILGQTPDVLNNRASLQSAIKKLSEIYKDIDKSNENEEIKICLSIIHNLLDKNEAVLAKMNAIPLLLDLMKSSLEIDNEICLICCTILHDASQNNPMMQNHLYSHHGIIIVLNTLKNAKKTNYKIRTKLWSLIHVMSREHNPNFNIFLTNAGHQEINRILRIEQNNITDDLLNEILRVSRLINYMLVTWSDGNEKVFEKLNILKSVNWAIYSLHSYVIRLVSINNQKQQSILNRLKTAQLILDILMELINGIRMFIKRNDKCKKFIIANKNNKDITLKLKQLQQDLGDYCLTHQPHLKLEEKTKNGKPYRYKYYITKNTDNIDDDVDDDNVNDNDNDNDNENDEIYSAMKDIWNTINSILRHVKRYEDHCEQQRKLREIWRKTTKKGQQIAKREKLKKKSSRSPPPFPSSSLSSSSPSPAAYQMVLYRNNDEEKTQTTKHKKYHKHKKRKTKK